ncbi:Nn.00g075680.m01.CDS01 [Neocucurbitaria sp. VM-36]
MDQIPPEQLAILAKEDQGPLTQSIIIAFTIIAFICVCLRLFTRLIYQAIGWEDRAIVISMITSVITAVFQILQVKAGNGRHAMFIPFPEGVEKILKHLFLSIIFYNISLTFTKVSILLQYGRIFTLREMRIPLHVVMGICVAWGITTLFTSIFTCVPVRAYWKILEQSSAKCIDNKTIWYVNASINIMTDLLVATLPVRAIWGLKIPTRQRIALLCILTIGWFVCVVSILRLHALVVFAAHPEDTTWYSSATAYWSAIEVNLAIVCASLPALKPLLVKIIPGFSSHGSRGYGSTALSGRFRSHGLRSKATRNTVDNDLELASKSLSSKAYPSMSDESVYGKNIYVSHNFEQHVEENGHISDSESQKDLVPTPQPVHRKQ